MFILLSLAMPIFLNSKLVKFKNDEFKRNVYHLNHIQPYYL